MDFVMIAEILIILVFYFYHLAKNKKKLFMASFLLIEIILGIIFYQSFSLSLSLYFILLELIGFNFFLIHLWKHRISLLFYFLFYLTLGVVTLSVILVRDSILYGSFVITLLFFLARNNQKYIRKAYEDSANEYQNKIIENQVNEVQNIYLTMRGWRHDYHNHIQTLKAHFHMKQYDLALNYLNELEKDLDNVNQLVETGNVSVDAILNSKLSFAMKKNIDINYKVVVPKELSITDIDLCVLLGNLIDNGVESCEKMKTGKKFIRLYIGIFKEQLYISITNSTSELVRKFDEEYITTKRGNHGHGLKRINNIVNKYEGYINRKNEPGVFATEIMLSL